MKPNFKHFCFTLLFFAFTHQGFAQFSLGIKGHISMIGAPLVETQDFFSKKLRPTFNPGVSVFGEYNLNDIIAFQAELAFRQNRSHYLLRSGPQTIHTSIIDYVRLPLLLKLSQSKKWMNFIVFGGPNFGYATGIKSAETVGNVLIDDATYHKLDFETFNIRRFDLAVTVGLGIEKTIAQKFRTSMDIRYDYGVIDVIKVPSNSYVNRGFTIEMGILIPISKTEETH